MNFGKSRAKMMLENKVLEQDAEYMEGRRELDEAVERSRRVWKSIYMNRCICL